MTDHCILKLITSLSLSSFAKISSFKLQMQSSMELEGAEIIQNLSPFDSD